MKKFMSFVLVFMTSVVMMAADFEEDGVSYGILSSEDHTVEVVNNNSAYVGDLVIPARVQHDGVMYTVVALHFQAFFKCTELYSVSIPETVEDMGEYSFTQCTSLQEVLLPSNAVSIPNGMFWGCSSLKSITLPEGITQIGEYAFSNCSVLEEINMPAGIDNIGKAAFMGTALKEFTLPDKVVDLSPFVLALTTRLEKVTLHNNLETIGECAFQGNTAMRTIILPEKLKSIAASAFAQCISLSEIRIPDGITAIPEKCFYNDMALQTVVMGKSVTTIGSECFARYNSTTTAPQLKNVYLCASEIVSGGDTFIDEACQKATLHVPSELVEAYKAQPGWQRFCVVAIKDGELSSVEAVNSEGVWKADACYSIDGKLLHFGGKGSMTGCDRYMNNGIMISGGKKIVCNAMMR